MKQAYRRIAGDWGNWNYEPIELLPHCKRVTKHDYTCEYQQARKKFLWFIPYKIWVNKRDIRWYPMERVEYYECSCGEEDA